MDEILRNMLTVEDLEDKLHELLKDLKNYNLVNNWKVLGQEQDGSFVVSWDASIEKKELSSSNLGIYNAEQSTLDVVYNFQTTLNLVQASVNQHKTLIGYVIKNGQEQYECYVAATFEHKEEKLSTSPKQSAVQFLYRDKDPVSATEEIKTKEKFLVFVHQQSITLHQKSLTKSEEKQWTQNEEASETLVHQFSWAQWEAKLQSLFYVSLKAPQPRLVQGEEEEEAEQAIGGHREREAKAPQPTLSCLQFHDELPHETVLNIPLSLPEGISLPNFLPGPESLIVDIPIPLRIHDSSLELSVICSEKGTAYICHHYIFHNPDHSGEVEEDTSVNFAYSVTALHHSCVVECVVADVPASLAYNLVPTFVLHGDQHLLVFASDLFTHLLDIGSAHEPCNHVMLSPSLSLEYCVSPVNNSPPKLGALLIDTVARKFLKLRITKTELATSFKFDSCAQNRVAILHQLLQHYNDQETVAELMKWALRNEAKSLTTPKLIHELLIGGTFATATKNLSPDALPLVTLLPLTSASKQPRKGSVWLQQKELWNTAMTLLSPQQRLVPFRADTWTRLWEAAHRRPGPRFSPTQVADKLLVSLLCYQPEALSRSSTPLSPGPGMSSLSSALPELYRTGGRDGSGKDGVGAGVLPFLETESCTASKQEHVVSVNLRELSMHLLKGATQSQPPRQHLCASPMHVHAVATRLVAAQLDTSRHVCRLLAACAGVEAEREGERGFLLIVEALAFPLPQGFTSFFTYLGYRSLPWPNFLQYSRRHVFELHVDAVKAILGDMTEKHLGVEYKLGLLQLLPRTRAKRILNQWGHPVSYMLRAREHALLLLSGESANRDHRSLPQRRIAAFPSADRLSPLDTFLDLLTAKASLTELDIPLLVEATITSTENFLA
ncbi:hypothetical protein B566_EDAN004029 [Ephemera danica]|nr:hypothetical protein B566_EDAN004029 [Ephemera danica]